MTKPPRPSAYAFHWSAGSLALLTLSLLKLGVCQPADYARWYGHREDLKKDPSVLRFYTFTEKEGDSVQNQVGKDGAGDLTIAANPAYIESHPTKTAKDFPRWTSGRFGLKSALSFGVASHSLYGSHFYNSKDNHLTAEMWVRVNREPGQKTSTELCYVEDTVTSGWRVTSSGNFTLFQIARPPGKEPGQGSVSAFGPALSGHVWHQVVAVLDEKAIALYIDGKLASTKEYDGLYTQPKMPDKMARIPELDSGGLVLGNRTVTGSDDASANPTPQFDMDEFVLYGRALSAEEISASFAAGSPDMPAARQMEIEKDLAKYRAALDSIAITIPTNTFGYFETGQTWSARVAAPANPEIAGPLQASWTLTEFTGAPVAAQKRALTAGENGALTAAADFKLPRAGLYRLQVAITNEDGAVLRQKLFDVAGIRHLQNAAGLPLTTPLAGHDVVQTHPADLLLGARMDRMIAPFTRILPDGTYDWKLPDLCVNAARTNGLEPLYTIYPPFNMPKNSPQELAKDPQRWADWVRTLVGHFKGQVKYWEIWNEPNAVPGFSANDYVTLLKTAYGAIKETDPAATVVGSCGVYTIPQWTEAVLAAGGGPYMDVLSVHNYIGSSPITYRNRFGKVRQVQELLKKYLGHTIPVWNSEGGIHQPARINGRMMTDDELLKRYGTRANKQDGWPVAGVDAIMMTTEHRSACWNVQSILLDLADGDEKYFTLMGAGTFYPFKSSSQGLPTEKGIAYAALSSVVANSKKIEWLKLSNSKAAAIIITDNAGKSTAVLFSDLPLEFTFESGAAPSFKGRDFLGNDVDWRAVDGALTIKTTDEPVYIFDVPANFAERQLLSSNSLPASLRPGQKTTGTLQVKNPGKSPLNATLQAITTAGQVTMDSSVKINANSTQTVSFQFEADATSRGAKQIRFVLKAEGKSLSQLEVPFYAEGPATAIVAITADGTVNWSASPGEKADQASQAVIGKPDVGFANENTWQGAADCSFTVKTGWKAGDGLYLQVDIVDDVLHPTPKGNVQPWLWDGLELFVDTRAPGKRDAALSPGAQQIMVIPGIGKENGACTVLNMAGDRATVNATFTGRVTEKGYVLEGKLTPKAGSAWETKAGDRIGLDFAVDDNDNGVKRKTQLTLHGTINNATDASRWGEYELGG